MTDYLIRRFGWLILLVIVLSMICFLMVRFIPGDAAIVVAGDDAPAEVIESIRKRYGLDKPLLEQYRSYMYGLVHADLGRSIMTGKPVSDELMARLPATVELASASVCLALLIGVPLAIASATHRGGIIDHVARLVAILGVAAPVFWEGLVLQIIFYSRLGWFPAAARLGMTEAPPPRITGLYTLDSLIIGDFPLFIDAIKHLFLPALCLSHGVLGQITRMLRSSLLEVLMQDYIRTARAKGLHERIILYRHALKNSILPVLTVLGLVFGRLLGGSIVTETVFSWPGIGSYAVRSIVYLDYPAIGGVTILACMIFVLVNLVIDILYVFADPRIRY